MSTMGLFDFLKIREKEAVTGSVIAEIEAIKKIHFSLDYTKTNSSLIILYNGYPIAKVYNNLFIKELNWEPLASSTEANEIKDIYKKLGEIYKK